MSPKRLWLGHVCRTEFTLIAYSWVQLCVNITKLHLGKWHFALLRVILKSYHSFYFVFLLLLFSFIFKQNCSSSNPPYLTIQSAFWLSLCLSLLACNASWVELWSKHQDNRKQKAMEKEQSKITSLSTQLEFPTCKLSMKSCVTVRGKLEPVPIMSLLRKTLYSHMAQK